MKKILFLSLLTTSILIGYAQVPEDAAQISWQPLNGTARVLAIGGAMGSLGGDLSAAYVNPAGLGFYRTREVVLSPGFQLNRNHINFRETNNSNNKGFFNLGTSGVVFGEGSNTKGRKSSAFALGISQTANFGNEIRYNGLNNYSSFAEMFAEELSKSNIPIDELMTTQSRLPYTAAPAYQSYLIDLVAGGTSIRAATENLLDSGLALNQSFYRKTTGGIYELALGGAINTNDKWLFGGTLGIPLMSLSNISVATETDTSLNNKNGFKSFEYRDKYQTTGIGGNLKLGVIYKPAEFFRIGLAVHTPSFMWLSDERNTFINNQLEDSLGNIQLYSADSRSFTNGETGKADYRQTTPWKAILSASFVFREVEDVSKQRGFITADVEYVNHNGSRFNTIKTEGAAPVAPGYYDGLNKTIQQYYRGVLNVRAGAELKLNTWMLRAGFASYGNPYKEKNILKASRTLLSAGIGYRNKGIFVDLTYVQQKVKDVIFPYRLQDRLNTFATADRTAGNIALTVGMKF